MTDRTIAANERSVHATLGAGVVDSVTLSFAWLAQVEILSRDGAAEIYFTVDGSEPTVGGANTYVLPASIGSQVVPVSRSGDVVVKLISAGAPAYSVSGLAG